MDGKSVPVFIVAADLFLEGEPLHVVHEEALHMPEVLHAQVQRGDGILAPGEGDKDAVGDGRRRFDGAKKRAGRHQWPPVPVARLNRVGDICVLKTAAERMARA